MPHPKLLIALCLPVLFGSGVALGWVLGQRSTPPTTLPPTPSPTATATDWAHLAHTSFTRKMRLTPSEAQTAQPILLATAERIFQDRERDQLTLHLQVLKLHDDLAAAIPAKALQIKASQELLRSAIMKKFHNILDTEVKKP